MPKVTVAVPGASAVRFFPVVAESPGALIDAVVKGSKAWCKTSDTLACVDNFTNTHWIQTTMLATGACRVTSDRVDLKSIVSLPRWAGPALVQPALVTWWRAFLDHLAWHEGQHIKIQKAYDTKLKSLLVGHSCSKARAIIRDWQRSTEAAQKQFDKRDLDWPYPEYAGPGGFYGTP